MSETQPDTITPCRSSDENFPSQLEQQLRLHDEVTHALTASASIEEAYLDVLRSICESLSWDLGVLWLVDSLLGGPRVVHTVHTP